MKKIMKLLFVLFFLVGCGKTNMEYYDFAIVDATNISYFKKNGDVLEKIDSKKRDVKEKGLWFVPNQFFGNENYYYGVTSENIRDNLAVYIEKIDKLSHRTSRTKTRILDTATLGENKFYTITNNLTNMVITIYNEDLELEQSKTLEVRENAYHYPTDCIEVDGYLYVICGLVFEDKEYGYNENYLLKFDSNLNLVEEYGIPKNDGSFFSMINVGKRIYMTLTSSGLKTVNDYAGEYQTGDSGNEIWVFDLEEERVLEEETISLSISYPHNIIYDEKNNNFIIESGSTPTSPNHIWDIYNLDSKEEKILPIDSEKKLESQLRDTYCTFHGDWYYVVFVDELYEYNVNTEELNVYNLNEYGLSEAHTILFPKR
ncbi:MAG: hypothetical protein Q4C49_08700 [Bacillota bacterium]|nr:hypothetical protein [Bacillota bacterium]